MKSYDAWKTTPPEPTKQDLEDYRTDLMSKAIDKLNDFANEADDLEYYEEFLGHISEWLDEEMKQFKPQQTTKVTLKAA